jgi:hypothetical protein
MDPTQLVGTACSHQGQLVTFLAWAGGVMPVASIVTWFTARWNKLPPGMQTILHLIAGDLLHAIMGEPTAMTPVAGVSIVSVPTPTPAAPAVVAAPAAARGVPPVAAPTAVVTPVPQPAAIPAPPQAPVATPG